MQSEKSIFPCSEVGAFPKCSCPGFVAPDSTPGVMTWPELLEHMDNLSEWVGMNFPLQKLKQIDIGILLKYINTFAECIQIYWKWPPKRSHKYPKHSSGAAKRSPKGILLGFGSHRHGFLEVLLKCCRRPPTKTNIKVTSRLPYIGHLTWSCMLPCWPAQ